MQAPSHENNPLYFTEHHVKKTAVRGPVIIRLFYALENGLRTHLVQPRICLNEIVLRKMPDTTKSLNRQSFIS